MLPALRMSQREDHNMPSNYELAGVGARLRMDGHNHSADVVARSLRDIENLKMQLAIAYDIIAEEFMPAIAGLAIQDHARLNEFLMLAGEIKKELEK